ncbi:MAG TPA: C-terminal binding protein [Quisquiliibacterium sp.]|nr:C-terminal binding protein [Quisquiliibacterium sp.]HPA89766.1 C-terminal binding protein [Quisquiliibacterium sp.]
MKVLFTDYDMLDVSLERQIFREAGIELIEAQCRTEDEVVARAGGCSALLIQYAPVAERVFAAHPGIGLCSRIGAGFDTIDTAAAARHGVWVANSPDYGVGEVSTHALAMMLSVIRGIARYDRDIHNGQWHYTTVGRIPRASNLTVGVLGLGRIGKRFAHIARNTFKRVIAHDPHLIDGDFPAYVERVSLEELFSQADAISIHCLLNDETRGLVDGRLLRLMKPGSYLVNTARGAIVDVGDLTEVVQAGRLAGVGLDVLPTEPVPADHPLLADPRVLFSPHAAFYSVESEVELRRKAAMNIVSWMRTGRPDYPVCVGTRRPPG